MGPLCIKGGFGLPLSLSQGCPLTEVMVLAIGDHYASKVALTCFLTSRRVACSIRVGVLASFLNVPSFFCLLFAWLASLTTTLSMAFFFQDSTILLRSDDM